MDREGHASRCSAAADQGRRPSHKSHSSRLDVRDGRKDTKAKQQSKQERRNLDQPEMNEKGTPVRKRKRQEPKPEKQLLPEVVGEEALANTPASGSNGTRQSAVHGHIVQTATSHPSMTPQETAWWAMSFDDLYQHAKEKNFGKTGKEGRKSGRVRIIKWLCEKDGITPYVAPSIPPTEASPIVAEPVLRPTGAISHPEAILRTSNPALQRLIDVEEQNYKQWTAADLLELAMQRSYQLLKDSQGKLPSKSITAMANWLASWDVLKSNREKKWWLGDGIDLVNRAKAMGYQGPSKKYDVIVWLRTTPEDSEAVVTEVAEPTPNKKPKRTAEEAVSKRPAKGSKRPNGWHALR